MDETGVIEFDSIDSTNWFIRFEELNCSYRIEVIKLNLLNSTYNIEVTDLVRFNRTETIVEK